MLVRFDSKVGTLTTFGDVAVKLLRLMGQSGSVPGAILAADIPTALQRLRAGVGADNQASSSDRNDRDREGEPPVNLSQRAFPLIELFERAAKNGADVIWEQESRATTGPADIAR